jgi:hypothetical protein
MLMRSRVIHYWSIDGRRKSPMCIRVLGYGAMLIIGKRISTKSLRKSNREYLR